jgi:ArsR family transcriptional regulator, arsenate/arsenite/antimonite-responsive transcriptional repressor
MEAPVAAAALAALGHESRLQLFRLLVRAGARGAGVTELARLSSSFPGTVATHLAILHRAGLVESRGEGAAAVYAVATTCMQDLVAFLREDWGDTRA